ncbi:unnamed protein product [Dracunculus medinensis]|uniref:ShKT domain-containing protein n=1 Tax=Dracunculus medinensis TaxID=318479 RepID=A0A0N4UNK3_DRAME|nr:unnamed protein product [Dracunculus medinensis]
MFALLFLLGILKEVESGGLALTKCLAAPAPAVARPSPPPSACKDKDAVVCTAVFAPLGSDAANNANPANAYLVNANCQNATLVANAEALCPSSCAVCCLTPEFNCDNAQGADCAPFTLSPDLCTNPLTSAAALANCPKVCGLCNRPGAGGRCPDIVTNCAALLPLLTCQNAYMQQNCMTTCRITTCLSTTTSAGAASACSDSRANCAEMASLCNTPPYSTVMAEQCRRTCRLCT